MRTRAHEAIAYLWARWEPVSLERLVVMEVRDSQAERVDRDERIGHFVPNDEHKMRQVAFPPVEFVLARRIVKLLEFDGCFIGWCPQILDGDVSDSDFDLVALSGNKGVNTLVFLLLFNGRVGETAIHEVKRPGEVVAHGRPYPPIVAFDEIHQEVANLCLTRLKLQTGVSDRLGMSDIVDAYDQRLQVTQCLARVDIQHQQAYADGGKGEHGDAEVTVRDERRAILLDIKMPGVCQFLDLRRIGVCVSEWDMEDLLLELRRHELAGTA